MRLLIEIFRGRRRWLATAALLALAPKCLLCVVAYTSAGAALGLGGPEICGAPASWTASWVSMFTILGIALGFIAGCRHRRSLPPSTASAPAR